MTVASRWRTLLALTVAAVLLVIAGCTATNSDGGETTPSATSPVTSAPPSSSAPATTADTRATPEVIVATWRAFWADVVAVSRTADWSSPRLATHATGRVLERLRGQFRGLAERGWVTRGTIRLLHPRAVDLKATTAKLRDCVDTARFVRVDRATGRAIDKIGGAPDDQTATLVRQAGAWKVEQTVVTGKCAG